LGGPVVARSGGFYWGGQSGRPDEAVVTDETAATDEARGRPPALGGPTDGFGRLVIVAGWLLIAVVGLAAVVGAVGLGPGA
jgi:hypothetical protein